MAEEEKKADEHIIKEGDPLIRHGKGIMPKKDDINNIGITDDDLDADPEKAVRDMEAIENDLNDVEADVKEKTAKVEQSINEASEGTEELDGPSLDEDDIASSDSVEEVEPAEPEEDAIEIESVEDYASVEKTPVQAPAPKPAEQNISVPTNVEQLSAADKMDEQTKQEMSKILGELRNKMDEIDRLTKELKITKDELSKTPPKKTEKLLEEIVVPSLEMLK